MQESSSEPPSDSSSPDLRHNSTPNATQRSSKMIKLQQERKIGYTVNTEEGLGNLRKFPREIRDMIYGFSEPPVELFEQGTKRHIDQALRRLSKCPLLSTSKQLCVEFLESLVRGKTFVACSEDSNPIEQFEHFFIFMSKRIDLISHIRGLGLQGCSGCIYASEITPALRLHCLELVVKDTKHLWNIHKHYNIPSSRLHLSFSYSRPFGLLDLLYELSGNDMYTSEDALLYLFHNLNIQTFPRDCSASLQSLHNSIAYEQAQLDIYLQLKLKDVHKCLSGSRALEVDRETRRYVAESKKSGYVKSLVEFHTAIIHQTVDLWSALEKQNSADGNVDSAGSKTTLE